MPMIEQDFDNPRMWEAPKPFLRDFYVPYSVYDPTFHEWPQTSAPAPLDPCCTSCRLKEDQVMVCVYVEDEGYLDTWNGIIENAAAIESELIRKLQAVQDRILVQHYEENLPGMPDWEGHWKFIQTQFGSEPRDFIDRMFKLTGISMSISEPEGEWVVGYEFQTAWDMDHGLEIVTWNGRVISAAGMMELTSTGGSTFAGAKENQEYAFDEGDLRLA